MNSSSSSHKSRRHSLWGLRFCARLVDYFLLYLLCKGVSFVLPFAPISFSPFFLLALPLLWAPLHALFLSTWGTTVGKALFGLSVRLPSGKKLSYAKALKHAFWFGKNSGALAVRSPRGWLTKATALICVVACFGGIVLETSVKEFSSGFAQLQRTTGWERFSVTEGGFAVDFPSEPELESKHLDVPSANRSFNYNEYKSASDGDVVYSASSLELPKRWKVFGSSTLLKKAVEIMVANDPESYKLVNRQLTMHQNQPAIDFTLNKEGNEVRGRLLLIGTTLYRLTVTYQTPIKGTVAHQQFFDSFSLEQKVSAQ